MSQLDRLEALLTRVQEQRRKPRLSAVVSATVPVAAPAAMPKAAPVTVQQVAPSLADVPPERAPVHQAPSVAKPASPAAEAQPQAASASRTQTGFSSPKSPAVTPPSQPERLELPRPEVKGPVAVVTAPAPGMRDLTFGELLARSLALRPR